MCVFVRSGGGSKLSQALEGGGRDVSGREGGGGGAEERSGVSMNRCVPDPAVDRIGVAVRRY